MQYIEIHLQQIEQAEKELIYAFLPSFGFSQWEELDTAIKAYALTTDADLEALRQWVNEHNIQMDESILEETNWNAIWESNFQPVEIPGKIYVRADFHPAISSVEHDIIITPKMSFGTGHHATTKMMMEAMLEIDFKGKRVLDFGTGTGILAILAEKLGAEHVLAIDNDNWSFENAMENIAMNKATKIKVQLKDDLTNLGSFDIILANINKNILTDHANSLSRLIDTNGGILISGLLSNDYEDICSTYEPLFGSKIKQYKEQGWIAISFNIWFQSFNQKRQLLFFD